MYILRFLASNALRRIWFNIALVNQASRPIPGVPHKLSLPFSMSCSENHRWHNDLPVQPLRALNWSTGMHMLMKSGQPSMSPLYTRYSSTIIAESQLNMLGDLVI